MAAFLHNMTPQAQQAWRLLSESWGQPLSVTSAYRDPEHNARVGGARGSQHVHGNAFDIDVSGLNRGQRIELIRQAQAAGFRGTGVYENSLHFDVGPLRAWGPSYRRDSLPEWAAAALGGGSTSRSSVPASPTLSTMSDPTPQPMEAPQMQKPGWQDAAQAGALALNSLRGPFADPNMAARFEMQARRQDEQRDRQQAQQEKNRTLQWLRTNVPQLAGAVEAGALTPSQALQMAMQRPDPVRGVTMGDRLVNPVTGEVMADFTTGPQAGWDKDTAQNANTLRDDLRADLQDFGIVRDGFQNVQQFYENPNAVSDYALAVAFAKIVDPGSVAREGEVAAVQNSAARFPAYAQALRNAVTGEGALTEETRQQIFENAARIYNNKAASAQTTLENYGRVAGNMGLNLEDVYMGGPIEQIELEDRTDAPGTQQRVQAANIRAAIQMLTPEARQEFDRLDDGGKLEFLRARGLL